MSRRRLHLAVFAVRLHDSDDAERILVVTHLDLLSDRIGVPEQMFRGGLIEHCRVILRRVILGVEEASLDDLHPHDLRKIIRDIVHEHVHRFPVDLGAPLLRRKHIGRRVRPRHRFDLRERTDLAEQPHERFMYARVGLLTDVHLDVGAHAPDVVPVIAEGTHPVRDERDRAGDHREDHQERDEDLGDDQRVRALAVPDQLEQMTNHCAPPRRALTGCMRAILHAGYTPEKTPNSAASSIP